MLKGKKLGRGNDYFQIILIPRNLAASSVACQALTIAPLSSLRVSDTIIPSMIQSDKSMSLSEVLKKSAPVKLTSFSLGFFNRISDNKASMKLQP